MGQFVMPQKRPVMPSAAAKPAGRPSSAPAAQPKVEPTKSVGTISPPLKPQPSVTAVKTILSRNASGFAVPPSAAAMTWPPDTLSEIDSSLAVTSAELTSNQT